MTSGKLIIASAAAAATLAFAGAVFADAGGPTVNLSSTASSTTNLSSIPVSAVFSSPVTGLSSTSIETTNGTIADFSGSGDSYTFNLVPSAQGTTTVMIPANSASDASSTGNQDSNTLSFNFDSTVPIISDVVVTPSTSGATITWTTDTATEGNVSYGATDSYGASTTMESSFSTSHTATISNLDASSTYNFQISATDEAGNTATTDNATFTTSAIAQVAPVISDITVSDIGTSSATITWMTDLASDGSVNYGTSTSYTASAQDSASSTMDHSVTLDNLSEGTVYHFNVSSTGTGGTATSSDMEFVTASTASTTPLAVDGTDTTKSDGVADNSFADGWQWTIHFTVPTNEDAFRIRFSDWGNASSSFATANNVQIYSPQSSNASTTNSAILETSNGLSDWIYLNGDTATLTPGRQVDLIVQVKIPFGTAAGAYSSNFTAQTYPMAATSTASSI